MLAPDYPITLLCDILGCSKSSYYYQNTPTDETDPEQALEAVISEWPTYGSRRVAAQLRRHGMDRKPQTVPACDAPERTAEKAETKGS